MSLFTAAVDTNMPADIFERIEQLDAEIDYCCVERNYEKALKTVEDIRAIIAAGIGKEVSPTRKKRLQDLSDEYRSRQSKMKKDLKEKRRIDPRVKRERPRPPTPPPAPVPTQPSGDPAPFVQLRPTPLPEPAAPPAPQPSYTPRPWNEAVVSSPTRPAVQQRIMTPPPTVVKPAQTFVEPAPRLQSPVASPYGRQSRPFGVSQTQFGTASPVYQPSTLSQSPNIVSFPEPVQYVREEPRPVYATPSPVYESPRQQPVYQQPPQPAYYQAPPPPQPVYHQVQYAEPQPPPPPSHPPYVPYLAPRQHSRHEIPSMTVFSPRFQVPIEYEKDEEDVHEEPPRRFAPKFKPKPVYTNTSVQTDNTLSTTVNKKEPVVEPKKTATVTKPTIPEAAAVKEQEKPDVVEPPKVIEQVSRLPQIVLKDDRELLTLIAGDPKTIASRGDVLKHCNMVSDKASKIAANGFLLKAYVLYEHCHKVASTAIRMERDELKIDMLSDLDSEYRREMLNLDRKIKLFGPVLEKTVETTAVAEAVEKPFKPSYITAAPPPPQSQLATTEASEVTSTMLACFHCGHMVEPVPSHSFPSWIACCCPAKLKCPDCGEVLDAGDHAGDEEEDGEEEDEDEEEEEDGDQEEEDQESEHNEGTITTTAKTTTDNTTTVTATATQSSTIEPQLCPQCNVQVEPVPVNSSGAFMAAVCPCFNKVTMHCPDCDYNLTDMVPAEDDDDEEEGDDDEGEDDEHSEGEESEEEEDDE